MHPDITQVVLSEEVLQQRIREMGATISADYQGESVVAICVMKGAIFFTTDLVRAIKVPLTLDFITVASYGATTVSSGHVQLVKDVDTDLQGRHVLIIEDILDSGRTLSYLIKHLAAMGPASLKVCTLLDKPERREYPVNVDYFGFTIPDVFVVGYGLDYDQLYRELPFIGELKPAVYAKPSEQETLVSP
ncbi:MAG: hypoxanthine phosphoribosyltransferase, partial [Candidatus Sericytochromatia bacterium]|nr:hypoxanthine phosphoribosyltransferase [Candidatus Sericytochromatia bacterium]